ncbi:MAG: MBL fold metallo-hydrolase, partial [Anaerolineae bacterium]|nr:MBL fold metallo-hydrolase [Anaerolineae bacterium]
MFNLRVVQARFGDCLIVEHGSGKSRKNILVDGGPARVYGPYLRKELERIAAESGQVDLMVLTHVDNDHVLGLLELMRALRDDRARGLPDLLPIRRIWHNAFNAILPEAGAEAAALEEEVLLLTAGESAVAEAEAVNLPEAAGAGAEELPQELPQDLPAAEEEGSPFRLDEELAFGIGEGAILQLANELLGIPRNPGF